MTLRLGPATIEVACGPATRLYVLLGDPVAHSWSPRMQTAALGALGLDAVYVACAVTAADLGAAVADLRRHAAHGRIGGANVTVPHKQNVVRHVDALDAVSELCGAVNTLCVEPRDDGSVMLRGANTDVPGLQRALAEQGVALAGRRVVVLGAGGTARAAVAAAFTAGAALVRVAARAVPRAQDLLDDLASRWRGPLPALACADWPAAAAWLADTDVLVHATPLGLRAGDPLPCALDAASPALFVQDCVYGRGATPLVRAARLRGLRAADGRAQLVHQGAAALTLWTGRVAPMDVMRTSLEA
jgi:shikimate dehydrogenase